MPARVRRLDAGDLAAACALLDDEPVLNVYLRSELRLGGLRSGTWWGVEAAGDLRGLVQGGPLAVPWLPEAADIPAVARALDAQPPRMLVGPRAQVLALDAARAGGGRPRDVRDPQPLLVLDRRTPPSVTPSPEVRRGRRSDLDVLTLAAAAMHREEMGVDPLSVDPAGWRARMSGLVERGWSWVWTSGGEILFKAELSAWTPECAQVQGVYVAPGQRNRGVGAAGLAAVCAAVLRDVPLCSLYVNHFNTAALALYRHLGFEHVADFATLIY